jgi:hypothetical protein
MRYDVYGDDELVLLGVTLLPRITCLLLLKLRMYTVQQLVKHILGHADGLHHLPCSAWLIA